MLEVRCITKISEGDKQYMPGDIIDNLTEDRVASLERSGAAVRIDEPEPQNDEKIQEPPMDELPAKALEEMTVVELKELAKAKEVAGYSTMNKAELIATLSCGDE